MDPLQQQSPSPPSLVASYVDGQDQSVPPTPVSPISPIQGFHNALQMDGYQRQAPFPSPAITSPNPVKPVKRKRLAKACDACHRSKRRCDGTAPCANCDFAGKSCTYTDPSGRAVAPPRTRSVDLRPGHLDGWPHPVRNAYTGDQDHAFYREIPVPTTLDPSPSPLDATLTRELVNRMQNHLESHKSQSSDLVPVFFAHCHPATLIIHRSTFLSDLSRAQVPAYLLLGVFALAAPYSLQQSLRTSRSWHAGERFASEAASMIFSDAEHTSDLSDSLDSLRIRPCLELAQTLCLLQAHERVMRRVGKPNRFIVLAQEILQAIGAMAMDQSPAISTFEGHLRNESMRRTFWYIYQIGLISSAFAQQSVPAMSDELSRLRLPVEEAFFDLPRLENRPGMHPSYDYLQLPVGNKTCRSEFGNLIRVSRIYAAVVSATSQKTQLLQVWDPDQVTTAQMPSVSSLEVGLRRWLEFLPDSLRLTQENLGAQLSQLDGGAGAAAWAFTWMHMLAEVTVLALREFADVGTEMKVPRILALREQKALENLTMILGAMGQRGRANLTMATFLVAVGKHLSPQDPQVATWFDEYFRMWGVSYDELMSNQFRMSWCTVGTMISTYSRTFRESGDASQVRADFDYDMDFGVPEQSERRLSNSDASSNGQSVAPSALTDIRRIVDDSASHVIAGRYFIHEESQILRDFTGPSGPPGRSTNGVLPDIRLMREEEAGGRLGALAGATAVNSALHSGSSSRGRTHSAEGGFMGERMMREHLPALVTNSLMGQNSLSLNNQHLYPQLSNSSGTGVSEESGSQSAIDSPSLAPHNSAFSVQSQTRYGSRLSPPSVSPYTSQTAEDVDLGWTT